MKLLCPFWREQSQHKAPTTKCCSWSENSEYGVTSAGISLHSKLLLYIWFLLTILFAILNIVIFVYPFWLGSVPSNHSTVHHAYFGIYTYCILSPIQLTTSTDNDTTIEHVDDIEVNVWSLQGNEDVRCFGSWHSFDTILNVYFRYSTYLVGLAALVSILCVAVCFLIVFIRPTCILYASSFLQMVIAVLILGACLIYPLGWSDPLVRDICASEPFKPGHCEIKWSYMLAMLQTLSSFILSLVAVLLASESAIKIDTDVIAHAATRKSSAKRRTNLAVIGNESARMHRIDRSKRSTHNYGFSFR